MDNVSGSASPPTLTAFVRVRTYELDSFGHVNNAEYLHYLEEARSEYLRQLGLSFNDFERLGVHLVIIEAHVRYVTPARYGDEKSSLSVTRTLIGFPPRLLLGLLRRLFWRYFVHDFSAVSIFLVLGVPMLVLGLGFGIGVWAWLAREGGYASAGQVMIAAMPIILGVQLILQAVALDIGNVPKTPLSEPLKAGF